MCTACMLLASKLNETWHISTEKLVQYTSNSISHAELLVGVSFDQKRVNLANDAHLNIVLYIK